MTKPNSNPSQIPHAWSPNALVLKAQSYAEEMFKHTRDDWKFMFWSTLTLELLARAALAKISPALLADQRDWNNLLYSLGIPPRVNKFLPRSINSSTVFSRLKELISDFTPELEGFCVAHMSNRNEELHSGLAPFIGVSSSSWLPTYYRACKVLLGSMGWNLPKFIGKEEAKIAEQLIAAASDESAKAVSKSIKFHNAVWKAKDSAEQKKFERQASAWATRHTGHRVQCPSCGCDAILAGSAISAPIKSIKEHEITETQQYLPTKFECIACGLKISGLSELNAAGLGDAYKATLTYDATDYYAPEDPHPEYEPDFNEP